MTTRRMLQAGSKLLIGTVMLLGMGLTTLSTGCSEANQSACPKQTCAKACCPKEKSCEKKCCAKESKSCCPKGKDVKTCPKAN